MIQLGITGGMGSGKSTICKILESLDIPIYYADDRAKNIYITDDNVKHQVYRFFSEAFNSDGEVMKSKLAEIVFSNPDKLKILESIIHPAVKKDYDNWIELQKSLKCKIVAKEAALMYESGSYLTLNKTITISAPIELRYERVKQRNNITKLDFEARIANQFNDEKRRELADYEIVNDEKKAILPQIIKIIEELSTNNFNS